MPRPYIIVIVKRYKPVLGDVHKILVFTKEREHKSKREFLIDIVIRVSREHGGNISTRGSDIIPYVGTTGSVNLNGVSEFVDIGWDTFHVRAIGKCRHVEIERVLARVFQFKFPSDAVTNGKIVIHSGLRINVYHRWLHSSTKQLKIIGFAILIQQGYLAGVVTGFCGCIAEGERLRSCCLEVGRSPFLIGKLWVTDGTDFGFEDKTSQSCVLECNLHFF